MTSNSKKLAKLTGAMMVAGGAVSMGLAATPAQASAEGCPQHYVCVDKDKNFLNTTQIINGYNSWTNLNSELHDEASSWRNGNVNASMTIGEWRNGYQILAQTLAPGTSYGNLKFINFNDRADFVKQA